MINLPRLPRPLFIRLLAGLALFLLAQLPLTVSAGWTLVWQDEFDETDPTLPTQNGKVLPDPAKWGYDRGGWGWGNNESQFYTNPTSPDFDTTNSWLENGQLVIEVRDDTGTNGNPDLYFGNDYTSARLLTKGKFDQLYGKFEARIKVPQGGSGLWPAFWMLGADFPDVRAWPFCGEIDIMEYVSRLPNEVFGTIHGPGYSGGASFGSIYGLGGPVAAAYHTYTVEWEPDEIRWYFDGIHYHTANPADVAPNDWVFNESSPAEPTDGFFMILNVAIGGDFGGFIDAPSIPFPTQMLVDYVRVYEQTVTNPQLVLTKTGTLNDDVVANGFADPGETIDYTFSIENTGDVPLTDVTVTDPLVTVSGGPAPAANFLSNEGFETGAAAAAPTDWDVADSGGIVITSDTYWNSGGKSLLIDSTGAGDWASPNASQTFTAMAGEEFNFKGYMYTPTGFAGASFGLLKIEFRDGLGDLIDPGAGGVSIGSAAASPFFGAESNVFLNSGSPAATWIQTEVQAVAPAGTATVTFLVLNVNEPASTIPMYFDDIEATDVATGTGLTLAVGQTDSTTYTATYTITQADIDAGQFVNTASATSAEGASDDDTEITTLTAAPLNSELTLTKTGTFNDESGDGLADPGETISYTFSIENTGDLPLTNIVVTDPDVTVVGTPAGPTNLLANEGFEAPIGAEWSQNLSGGSAANSSVYANTGSNSLIIDSTGASDWASPNLSQTFPASPGDEFNLQGWMLAPPAGIPGGSFGLLKIEFTDGSGTALDPASVSIGGSAGAPFFGAESTPFLDNASATESWIFTETQAVAPTGTVNVRFVVLNVNEPLNLGPMYFDDIQATDVNASDPPVDLLPGETDSTTYTATYTITQADIDAGGVINTASADSAEGASDDDQEVTLLPQNFDFTISTTPVLNDENGDGYADVGETISYPFTVENTGNVTLTDFEIVMITLTGGPTTLDVGEVDTTTFEGTYTISGADIQAGAVSGLTATGYGSNVGTMDQPLPEVNLTDDPDGDPDGDSISNFFERAYALNLFSPDSLSSLPFATIVENAGQKYMSLTYRRPHFGVSMGPTYTTAQFQYTVEFSDDLGSWSSGIGDTDLSEFSVLDNGDGSETATVRYLTPLTPGAKTFLRLNVIPTSR